MNLNTITSQNVLNGLLNVSTSPVAWAQFIESRKGIATDMFALDNNLPTRFGNPFRSFAGRYNIPNIPALQTAVGSEVNATLLRSAPGGSSDPLFNYKPPTVNPGLRHRPQPGVPLSTAKPTRQHGHHAVECLCGLGYGGVF